MKHINLTVILGASLLVTACGGGGEDIVRPDDPQQNALPSTSAHGMGYVKNPNGVRVPVRTSTKAQSSTPLPTSVDLTAWAVPVGNQGSVGSCVSWTIAYEMLGWYANFQHAPAAAPTPKSFAPMYMHSQIHLGGVNSDGGTWPQLGFDLLVNQGNDSRLHYTHGDYDWATKPTTDERTNAANFKITGYTQIYDGLGSAGDVLSNAIKQALANNQPVLLAINVRNGFDNMPATGADTDTTSSIRGSHAVTALGYDSEGVIIQNHWGTGWGNKGFGKLAWNVIAVDVLEADIFNGPAVIPKPTVRQKFARVVSPLTNLVMNK